MNIKNFFIKTPAALLLAATAGCSCIDLTVEEIREIDEMRASGISS